jgi:phage-related minor tail protein
MGVGNLDEFAGSISNISALAAGAGIGLDELGASFAYVSTKGLSAGQAQKQLKGIISTLVSPSENLAKLYESLGIESGQAMLQQYGLAESLYILKNAIGDDQAFAGMIGSAEAATVALALTEDQYVNFAGSFAEGMGNITEAARGVQLESIEAKMARLDSVSRSLQAQIGQDINGIKGFFIDFKFGFLSNIVSPLMSSPVGGVLSKIAAGTGMVAKGILDMGSGALNAAAQMTTLAANISNAGGIAKLFHSGIGLAGSSLKILATPLRVAGGGILGMGKSIIGALPAIGSYIASMWASVAATIAATWPILAIIAGVALLAAGVYLLIKHWDKVSGFFAGLWNKVKGAFSAAWDWIKNLIFGASDWVLIAVSVFFPFIGIPALIIKHWDKIKEFFSNLWGNITAGAQAVWNGLVGFFTGIWEKIKGAFSAAWDWIKNILFGTSDWILGAVAIFMPIVGIPALIIKHWDAIKDFFGGLWEKIKTIFQGFIDWIGGKVEAFIAPFKAIGDVVGGVFNKVGGFFKGLVGGGKQAGSDLNDAFASGILSNASAPGDAFNSSLQTVSRQMPHSDAQEGPLSQLTASGHALTDTFASGIDSTVIEQKSSVIFSHAMPNVDFPNDISLERNASLAYTASSIDTGALSELAAQSNALTSGINDISLERNASLAFNINEPDLREKASLAFPDVMPYGNEIELFANETSAKGSGKQNITVQNLYLQADDCESLLDFVRMIMHSVNRPEEVPA